MRPHYRAMANSCQAWRARPRGLYSRHFVGLTLLHESGECASQLAWVTVSTKTAQDGPNLHERPDTLEA
jgi:hypothetical protein